MTGLQNMLRLAHSSVPMLHTDHASRTYASICCKACLLQGPTCLLYACLPVACDNSQNGILLQGSATMASAADMSIFNIGFLLLNAKQAYHSMQLNSSAMLARLDGSSKQKCSPTGNWLSAHLTSLHAANESLSAHTAHATHLTHYASCWLEGLSHLTSHSVFAH